MACIRHNNGEWNENNFEELNTQEKMRFVFKLKNNNQPNLFIIFFFSVSFSVHLVKLN